MNELVEKPIKWENLEVKQLHLAAIPLPHSTSKRDIWLRQEVDRCRAEPICPLWPFYMPPPIWGIRHHMVVFGLTCVNNNLVFKILVCFYGCSNLFIWCMRSEKMTCLRLNSKFTCKPTGAWMIIRYILTLQVQVPYIYGFRTLVTTVPKIS